MYTNMVVNEWVQTDSNQWLRQATKNDKFEMIQINITPKGNFFVTFNYVDMTTVDQEDLIDCLLMYGYSNGYTSQYNPQSLGVEFLDFDTQIAAECYLETNEDNEAKFQGTREECEAYVNKVIAYLNKNPMFLEELEEEFYRHGNSFINNME